MELSNESTMWEICPKNTIGARKVNAYPKGVTYIVQREICEDIILSCKKKAWRLVFASDGMEAELLTNYYVISESGDLMGHLVGKTVLWYADFDKGGNHEYSYINLDGDLVRLGFSRW